MKKNFRAFVSPLILPVALTAALSSCSSAPVASDASKTSASAKGILREGPARPTDLTRELAWLRARQVAQVSYVMWFGLDEESEDFEGRTVINFELRDAKKALAQAGAPELSKDLKALLSTIMIDFEGATIRSISVNAKRMDPQENVGSNKRKRYDGHRLHFLTSELNPTGSNRIEISYTRPFSRDGHGFHRFKDPADGNVYLYTDFEPYRAHELFPCFDQPDLKASYEVTVESPEDWEVISNTASREVSTVDGRKSWAFPPSPLFSTYVFALHAGPYASWKDDADGIPVRLFVRESLKEYVDHKEWLDVTKRGLEYYSSQFGYPYPYSKYDQVLVPDFNEGAMENVAAVTFSERYVRRSKPTLEQRRDLANTILHEMAHMWFGDLVTMRWWNGLWLNESFASYAAAKAVHEATELPGSWQDFFQGMKGWAYWEDQTVVTHPIEVPVPDTDHAKSVFDGITYGKGASTLKQLAFYLGEDDFREGLQRYFQKFALRNTTTHDFVKTLQEASGKDLQKWQKTWLTTAGVNTVRADWACDEDGKISKLDLVQGAPEGGTEIRPHRTQVAFYDLKGESLVLRKNDVIAVTYSAATTPVEGAIGRKCPAFVFPNHEDHDYVKVELDPKSLEVASTHVSKAQDSFLRTMLWHTLSVMVTDGKMRPQDFYEAVLTQGVQEKDPEILSGNLERITKDFLMYLPTEMRAQYWPRMEETILKHLRSAPAGSDQQRAWFDAFLRIATQAKSVEFARALLAGKASLAGLPIKQDERWSLVQVLAANGATDSKDLIAAELKRDATDTGKREAFVADAAIPDAANRELWIARILKPLQDAEKDVMEPQKGDVSLSHLRAVMRHFNDPRHPDQFIPAQTFFKAIAQTGSLSDSPYVHHFPRMYPDLCDPMTVAQATTVLNGNPGLPAEVIKSLKVSRQEDERCIRSREKARQAR